MAVTEFRASAESGKFTLKSRSESGKLSTIGCHFPPKATNFGTLWPGTKNNTTNREYSARAIWWSFPLSSTTLRLETPRGGRTNPPPLSDRRWRNTVSGRGLTVKTLSNIKKAFLSVASWLREIDMLKTTLSSSRIQTKNRNTSHNTPCRHTHTYKLITRRVWDHRDDV